MSLELSVPELGLSEEEAQSKFDALQRKLDPLWRAIANLDDDGEQTIVVVPSLTVDFAGLEGSVLQAYEERFLFLLLLLRQPSARLVYVTSQPIQPTIVDYYLGLLPGVISSHARDRLFLLAPEDGAPQPLSVKLLQRPRLLQRLKRLIPNPNRAHLVPFNTTRHERDLALRLGIPLYGADPRLLHYGTKSGCRALFAEAGVSHPAGRQDIHSRSDLVDALADIRRTHPDVREVMVKHNDGVSGEGNAILELDGVDASSTAAIEQRLASMRLEAKHLTNEAFIDKFVEHGGIVEQRIVGTPLTSPSVQLRVTPLGDVELLSTHDQLLGGEQGQKYLGCTFPAADDYAAQISRESMKVGKLLAAQGVLGRFAIDFICAKAADGWSAHAIEINLRKGGTTHPFLTLQFLTDGAYDPEANTFTARSGPKFYVATDALVSARYRVFTHQDLFDIAVRHSLHFDHTQQTGVVLHMMSAVGDYGRVGLTAIGDSRQEANDLYEKMSSVLDQEADAALAVSSL